MTLPIVTHDRLITGPETARGAGSWRIDRQKRTQARPYNLSLPYFYFKRICYRTVKSGNVTAKEPKDNMFYPQSPPGHNCYTHVPDDGYSCLQFYATDLALARNRAMDRFKKELGAQASAGITLAQSNLALTMIANRALQLGRFVRHLKRFDLPAAWRSLGVTPDTHKRLVSREARLKSGAKYYASNFLEVHFGWAPLVSDMYNAADTLQSPLPFGRVKASARQRIKTENVQDESNPIYGAHKVLTTEHEGSVQVKCGAEVSVSNPNLYLANRLGLTNPALIAYDLVPFSFVANWFVTLEQFLSQYNQFLGLEVRNPWTVEVLRDFAVSKFRYSWAYPNWGIYEWDEHTVVSSGFSLVRTNDFPAYAIVRKPTVITSPQRAITAVALLLQRGFR